MKNALILLCLWGCHLPLLIAQSGVSWSPPLEVASSGTENNHPRIAIDRSGNPLIIWGSVSDQAVYFSRRSGGVFTAPVAVNPAGMPIAAQSWMGPDLASKGDTVYIVVKEVPEASDTSHIYLIRSTNGGISFDAPVQVDDIADSISRFPAVTTDDMGNPLVAFMKFDPSLAEARWVVSKSDDCGGTFATDVLASGWSGGTVCDCCPGAIVTGGTYAAMLYRDANANIRDSWAGISADEGVSFPQGIAIDQQGWMLMSCPSSGPDGVIIGDTLYSTFMNGNGGTNLVYYSKSPLIAPMASAGIPLTGLTAGLSNQNFPRIAAAGSASAIAWRQVNALGQQLAVSFTSDITQGLPAAYDTVWVGSVANIDIAMTEGKIFVVWQDDVSGTVVFAEGTYTPLTHSELGTTNDKPVVFPNPATDSFSILPEQNFPGWVQVSITDPSGKVVMDPDTVYPQGKITLDVSGLANGIYIVSLISSDRVTNYKLIVQHP